MAKKILIVDDEPDVLKVAVGRLKKAGYDTIQAVNGQEGLDAIRGKKPDLVLLDLAMPGINGYEVCRQAKGDEATKDIPIILFTASIATKTIDEKVKELGADDFIIKPFNHEELLEKIGRVLTGK